MDSICSTNVTGKRRSVFSYKLGTTNATLVYTNQGGQLSKADPVYLDFEFSTGADTDFINSKESG